ncbi:hypothetical protein [Rhodoligotrophos ferricapiens]|uniref:hypothetical protein n=1 Tax=Rhodoligotrophos ferricapiens TaxID=3069264 RepID=UPI00315DA6AE
MAVCLRQDGMVLTLTVSPPRSDDDQGSYLAALDEIAAKATPFGLLVAFRTSLDLAHEQRKAQNLWFKTSRARMNALCRAVAIVRRDANPQMQQTFASLWNFPVLVTDNVQAAQTFLAAHVPAEERS